MTSELNLRNFEEYRRAVLETLGVEFTTEDIRNEEKFRIKFLNGMAGGKKHSGDAIDLGVIDANAYDYDLEAFMNSLTENGLYRFDWDGFLYYVYSESLTFGEDPVITMLSQRFWNSEEGGLALYYRGATIEDDEVIQSDSDTFMTYSVAREFFATAFHNHLRLASGTSNIWTYCNSVEFQPTSPILYFDTTNQRHWYIDTISANRQPLKRMLRVVDLADASVFYQRSGTYSSGRMVWDSWYKFSGEIFDPTR